MKPSYAVLKSAHFSSDYAQASYLSGEALYAMLGYEQAALTRQSPAYLNTCAVRMSLALLSAQVPFWGRLVVKAGKYQGKQIEPGAKRLADQLCKPQAFGTPEVFTDPDKALDALKRQRGVVFFHRISGYDGGHIDLLEPSNAGAVCHSYCYFNCKEVWFWALV